ncbi:hypothetical protein ACE41H_24930 [Paenibacillus enshidis]|uniref:Uncharacterized protein n=1 Tax=Paenibacillus enshidis TaxID=1458439 RepID=A0ABV5B0K5_9BACL
MAFFIAQTIDYDHDTDNKKIVKDKELLKKLELCGFSRIFNSVVKDLILEIEVYKLQAL